jgi:hypothetical protein
MTKSWRVIAQGVEDLSACFWESLLGMIILTLGPRAEGHRSITVSASVETA